MALAVPAQAQQHCASPGKPRNLQVFLGDGKLTLTLDEPASWGSWTREGDALHGDSRYYTLMWRQASAEAEWQWNSVTGDWQALGLFKAYVFSGDYREVDENRRTGRHTVVNGTEYEFQVRTGFTNSDCLNRNSQWVRASGAPAATPPSYSTTVTFSAATCRACSKTD